MVIGQGVVVEPSALSEVVSWVGQPLIAVPALLLLIAGAALIIKEPKWVQRVIVPYGISLSALFVAVATFTIMGIITAVSYGGYAAEAVEKEYGVSLYNVEGTVSLKHARSSLSPNKEFLRASVYQESTLIGDAYIDIEDASTADQDATRYTLFVKDDALDDEYVEFSEFSADAD